MMADVFSDTALSAVTHADGADAHDLAATSSLAKLTSSTRSVDEINQPAASVFAKPFAAAREREVAVEHSQLSTTALDLRMLRNQLRLVSGLILLAFVLCHLTAHSFLLVSLERAGAALEVLMYPWRTAIGTAILISALLTH